LQLHVAPNKNRQVLRRTREVDKLEERMVLGEAGRRLFHREGPMVLHQGCTTCGPQAGSGPRRSFILPSEQVKKYKKRLLNHRDFMNEFKLH